ncbi:unnamed protein product [Amaranthus hypochondriacus]
MRLKLEKTGFKAIPLARKRQPLETRDSNASYRKCTDSRYNSFTVYQKHRRNIALVAGFAFSRRCWFLSSC